MRLERLPPDQIEALHEFYKGVQKGWKENRNKFSLVLRYVVLVLCCDVVILINQIFLQPMAKQIQGREELWELFLLGRYGAQGGRCNKSSKHVAGKIFFHFVSLEVVKNLLLEKVVGTDL